MNRTVALIVSTVIIVGSAGYIGYYLFSGDDTASASATSINMHINCPQCGHQEHMTVDEFMETYPNAQQLDEGDNSPWQFPCPNCKGLSRATREQ